MTAYDSSDPALARTLDQHSRVLLSCNNLNETVESMATTSVKSLNDLPYEVLLAILSKVKYTPQNLSAVCLTNRLLHDLMTTYRKSLIKNIGQHQFPLESIFAACASPSPIWLEDLSRQKSYLDDVLAVCARPMHRWSPGVLLFSDEEFDRAVGVGLYLGMQHLAPRSHEGHHGGPKVSTARLRAIMPTLPTTLLFCLHFASAVLAETIIRQVDLSPVVAAESSTAIRIMTEFIVCSTGYPALWLILGNFVDDGKGLQFEETKAMAKSHFILLVEAVIVCKAHGEPGVFDVGLKKAVELRLGRRARGALPDNLFNLYAKRIVRELDVAVMDALKKETLSDKAITQMLAECQ
jgi:hypothetical protein